MQVRNTLSHELLCLRSGTETIHDENVATLNSTTSEHEKFVLGGKLYDDVWQTSNMIIDNFRIYDTRALKAQEVERIYNYEKE
mgnify:CR=1 FL=1